MLQSPAEPGEGNRNGCPRWFYCLVALKLSNITVPGGLGSATEVPAFISNSTDPRGTAAVFQGSLHCCVKVPGDPLLLGAVCINHVPGGGIMADPQELLRDHVINSAADLGLGPADFLFANQAAA